MRTISARTLFPELFQAGTSYDYQLLADDLGADGTDVEDYGFAVVYGPTGERAEVRHVTPNRARAVDILALLARNQVSPVHLMDVVADCLAA